MTAAEQEEQNSAPKLTKPWQKFFAKFQEIETLKICKWTEVHHLAYFAQRYEQCYHKKFSFSFTGPPSRCTEIILMRKMSAMLGTSNATVIKEYIDWIFDQKIAHNNLQIRSLGYLLTPGLGNEFHFYLNKKSTILKSTELPTHYLQIIATLDLPISTYGDLAFAQLAVAEDPNSESRAPYKEMFSKLLTVGFNPVTLKDLK